MTSNIDDKLAKMQEFMAHQERQITDLNDIVTAQANQIDDLKKYIKIKLDKIENTINDENGDGEFQSISDEAAANKPPHY